MTEGRGGERSTDEAEAQWQTGARRGDMKVLLPRVFVLFVLSFKIISARHGDSSPSRLGIGYHLKLQKALTLISGSGKEIMI